MPTFSYEGVDEKGKAVNGAIEAASADDARTKLRAKGMHPTSVKAKAGKSSARKAGAQERERTSAFMAGSVSSKELTTFTRQFSTLIEAGLPVVRALDIMEQMLRPGALRNTVMDVRDEVEQGSSLSESLGKSGKVFDDLYISMIRAGEAGGLLGKILNRLAEFREKSQKLKSKIKGALVYPAAIMTIAGAILTLIVMFIIPKFQKMFADMNVEMPGMTQALMTFASVLVNFWYLVPLVPIGAVVTFILVRKTTPGKYYTDMASLYLPVFGMIIKKSSISRFCRTLGELTQAGVPILDALGILRTAVGNQVIEQAIGDIHSAIREGDNIADPMKRSRVFDIMVVNMVAVGEETGELDKMLLKIADNYDEEVDTLVNSLMSLLEPILIVGMGGTVGFIVIALFLPMIKVIETLNQ
jgi:type IV pilus assembly protein PilC